MSGPDKPVEPAVLVVHRYPWTATYLCAMSTLTFLASIFDWTVHL